MVFFIFILIPFGLLVLRPLQPIIYGLWLFSPYFRLLMQRVYSIHPLKLWLYTFICSHKKGKKKGYMKVHNQEWLSISPWRATISILYWGQQQFPPKGPPKQFPGFAIMPSWLSGLDDMGLPSAYICNFWSQWASCPRSKICACDKK
jgi:hypothetical protein